MREIYDIFRQYTLPDIDDIIKIQEYAMMMKDVIIDCNNDYLDIYFAIPGLHFKIGMIILDQELTYYIAGDDRYIEPFSIEFDDYSVVLHRNRSMLRYVQDFIDIIKSRDRTIYIHNFELLKNYISSIHKPTAQLLNYLEFSINCFVYMETNNISRKQFSYDTPASCIISGVESVIISSSKNLESNMLTVDLPIETI